MRERITAIIGPEAEGLRWLGTFHSVAAQILRRHCELVGLKSSFTILDTDDQERLLKQLIDAANIDPQALDAPGAGRPDRPVEEPRLDARQGPAERGRVRRRQGDRALPRLSGAAAHAQRLRLRRPAAAQPDLFSQHADVLADFHNRFKYILVDEYQDTNVAQYLWLRLLAQARKNVCCVGDDDQSIYGWRGAEVDNILRFERDFPGAAVIRLERNYRSTSHILAAASGLIAANKGRLGKTLWTEDQGGEKVRVSGVWDGEAEARLVADEIERWKKGPIENPGKNTQEVQGRRHPGSRLLPDAGVRGAVRHAADPLQGDRRPALLRAGGNPRRARLPAPGAVGGRRPGLRAHRQHPQARHRRHLGLQADHPGPRERRLRLHGRAGPRQHRRAARPHPHGAFHLRPRHGPLAHHGGDPAPRPADRDHPGGERLHRRAAPRQRPAVRRDGWRT